MILLDRQAWANSVDLEQSEQGLHCLQLPLHHFDASLYGKAALLNVRVITANFLGVRIFRSFTVCPEPVIDQ